MTKIGYEQDFYGWLMEQAGYVRAKDWEALDIDNIVEELEALGRNQRDQIRGHVRRLVIHFLKWAYQAELRAESWRHIIINARAEIDDRLAISPSLRRELPDILAWSYPRGRRAAADEAGLPLVTFPETCPWSLEQLQDEDFLPEQTP